MGPQEQPDAAAVPASVCLPTDSTETHRFRAMVVDDDLLIRKLATAFLQNENVDVVAVSGGAEAVLRVRDEVFDCIMIDWEMPSPNGLETIQILRRRAYLGKIVVCTAHDDDGVRQICIDAGADDYLQKPLTKDVIAQFVALMRVHPLTSSRAGEGLDAEIAGYLGALDRRCHAMARACAKKEMAALSTLADELNEASQEYGFSPIARIAQGVIALCGREHSYEDMVNQLRKLHANCQAAKLTA